MEIKIIEYLIVSVNFKKLKEILNNKCTYTICQKRGGKMSKKALAAGIIVVVIVAAIIGGYAYYAYEGKNSVSNEQSNNGKIVVKDDEGNTITLKKPASRIVSLAPSNTEILFAVGAGNQVVGVTQFCDYPPAAVERVKNGSLTVVGGFADKYINIEKIVSLKPDLVLAFGGGMQTNTIAKLRSLNITVAVLNPTNITGIYYDIIMVGELTGHKNKAVKIVDYMKNKLHEIENKISGLPKKKVFFVAWNNPLMTAGNHTFINYAISLAGGINIFGNEKSSYPIVNMEQVIAKNPDVIIITPHCQLTKQEILSNWSKEINAVKNGQVYVIDDDLLVRPGPRIIQGIEELAEDLHPNAFENTDLESVVFLAEASA